MKTQEYVSLIIDGQELKAKKNEKILWVALDSGIDIPNMCALRDALIPFGGCRLCLVEVESKKGVSIVTACSEPVREGMKVITQSETLNRLRKTALELMLSNHQIDCQNCPAVKKCYLLKLAKVLKVKINAERFKKMETNYPVDVSHPRVGFNPNKCVRCGKCVTVCPKLLSFSYYGLDSRISTFDNMPLKEVGCSGCLKCVEICPVGAFFEHQGDNKSGK